MLLPGPSYLESYSLCQWDTDAGTECLMLPVVSVIPDVSGIGYSSPEGPSQRRPGFLARSCLYAAKAGGGNRNNVSHTNQENKYQYALEVGGCFRVSLESVPASQVIKAKGTGQSNRWQAQTWEENTQMFHTVFNSNDMTCGHSNFMNRKYINIRHI